MSNNFYKIGDWNVICDICGKKRKRSQCKKTWDNYIACTVEKCWYPKHPNDFPRIIVPDGLPVPDARPRPAPANYKYVVLPDMPPHTKWLDPTLQWSSLFWRWDDNTDTPKVPFSDGNP